MDIDDILRPVVITLKPGDVLGVKCSYHLSMEQANQIKGWAEQVMPEGVKVLVYGPDTDLVVIRQEQAAEVSQ